MDCNVVFGYLFALASKNRRPGVFSNGQEPFVVVQGERGGIHVGVNYNGELCFGDNIDVECTNSMQPDTTTPDTTTQETTTQEVDALSNNKVGVEIEPDVKENRVIIQICSCAFVLNCFSFNRPDKPTNK